MTDLSPEDNTIDTMFEEAVNALRRGNKARAKELLTLLLKTDQNNSTYWVWLSAAVENPKERIYCLQTALKLNPENATAKRGLILLGALPPDESVLPFPMNRPRAWEQKLLLANEKPREGGGAGFVKNPVVRLIGVLTMGIVLTSVVVFGFVLPRQSHVIPTQTNTPGPSPTFTTTPTVLGATAAPTQPYMGPTPLWMLLAQTYTPTAIYVNTPRALNSRDQYRIAQDAYNKGDWDTFILNMKLIAPMEPSSPDIYYHIGEAYRFKGNASEALKSYNQALKIDPNFAPPYLGLARVRLMAEPKFNAESFLSEAIKLDPNFSEAYLERARYYILHNKPESALADLEQAGTLMPESPEVYMAYANAYHAVGDLKNALASAEKAYELDITALPVYKLLGQLYLENGDYQKAIDKLEVYVQYETQDSLVLAILGQANFELKNYKPALANLNKAMILNRAGLSKYYIYRGLANLELNNVDQAVSDLESALKVDSTSFDVNLGLARGYYIQEKFGSALLRADVLKSVAETDEQIALAFYWRALIQEKRGEIMDALKSWNALLDMSADVMTAEMRITAEEHLKNMVTPSVTPKPSITPKPSVTLKASATPSRTPTPKPTP